jgi:hypothetical protein
MDRVDLNWVLEWDLECAIEIFFSCLLCFAFAFQSVRWCGGRGVLLVMVMMIITGVHYV